MVGFLVFADALDLLIKEGLFNTVRLDGEPYRQAAFWFMYTGFSLLILGFLVDWIERRNIGIPGFLSWALLAAAASGAFIMPVSGFWLLLVPTIGLFRR
jgi:hypothetical protein